MVFAMIMNSSSTIPPYYCWAPNKVMNRVKWKALFSNPKQFC